jgi:porin
MNRRFSSIVVYAGLAGAAAMATVSAQGSEPTVPADNTASFAKLLQDDGINLRGSLIDQYARNPTGGVFEGHTNVGQFWVQPAALRNVGH